MGTVSPDQTVPVGPARDALLRMRGAGLLWDPIERFVGVDRRNLLRIMQRDSDGRITRRVESLVLAAEERLMDDPGLAVEGQVMLQEGDRLRWMINCLQARGWPGGKIGGLVGWNCDLAPGVVGREKVTVDLLRRVEDVFADRHTVWGPSRITAVRAWRSGKFPSDCYDLDADRSVRYIPVPGSLHPDLVMEACTFRPRWAHRRRQMLEVMHRRWGQWETEPCAAAALRMWEASVGDGSTDLDRRGMCGSRAHRHEVVPEVWLPFAAC